MSTVAPSGNRLADIASRTWSRALAHDFRGPDPYDGLNSKLLAPVLAKSRFIRLAVIQGLKRSPLDLRPILRVKPGYNPKCLALFLMGIARLPGIDEDESGRQYLCDAVLSLASCPDGQPRFGAHAIRRGLADAIAAGMIDCEAPLGWGYDFPWQAKAFLQPRYYPTAVATSFVLDALAVSSPAVYRRVLPGACRFVLETLNREEIDGGICFSYSPRDSARVLNASLFATKILCRGATDGNLPADTTRVLVSKSIAYASARQRMDGSWLYGDAPHWNWLDNLHTGYVLETLAFLVRATKDDRWDSVITRGLAYYRQRFFRTDGTPRYYPDRDFPLDGHTVAQSVLTFLALTTYEPDYRRLAERALARGIDELWDESRGHFVTRRTRFLRDVTPYMRWTEAWMFRALSTYLSEESQV